MLESASPQSQQVQQPKSTGNPIANSLRRLSKLKFSDYGRRPSLVRTERRVDSKEVTERIFYDRHQIDPH